MTRCIIHMGMHKTGTSSIQNSLHKFEDNNFLYAKLGSVPNHSLAMYSMFAEQPEKHHLHKSNGRGLAEVKEYNSNIAKELDKACEIAHDKTLLISGEDIGAIKRKGLIQLNKYFQSRVDEITIVGYIRPPGGFIKSSFQQRLKSGNVKHFEIEKCYRNYKRSFKIFDEIFGRENVKLKKYAPENFDNNCVVQDFCTQLGINLPNKKIVRVNEGLSRRVVSLLYTYCKFANILGFKNIRIFKTQLFWDSLTSTSTEKFRFSPDIIRPVLEKNRADIEWMEERLGESLEEDLGEHQPGDIRNESDLLMLDPVAVEKLLDMLGKRAPKGNRGKTPEEVASLVQALMENASDYSQRKKGTGRHTNTISRMGDRGMKVNELIEDLKVTSPEVLEGITDAQARNILTGLLMHINKQIKDTDEGVISFSKLGKFRIRNVEKEVEGRKENKRRIFFKPVDQEKSD